MTIEAKRQRAAARYPEFLTDTLGRKHYSVPRAAILAGKWDGGKAVQDALDEAYLDALQQHIDASKPDDFHLTPISPPGW